MKGEKISSIITERRQLIASSMAGSVSAFAAASSGLVRSHIRPAGDLPPRLPEGGSSNLQILAGLADLLHMQRVVVLVLVVVTLAACGGGTTYDPLAQQSASFDVRPIETGDAADLLLLEVDPIAQTACAVGEELDRLRPHLDKQGSGVFDHQGQLVKISVHPVPESITDLWDQGKLPGWSCRLIE